MKKIVATITTLAFAIGNLILPSGVTVFADEFPPIVESGTEDPVHPYNGTDIHGYGYTVVELPYGVNLGDNITDFTVTESDLYPEAYKTDAIGLEDTAAYSLPSSDQITYWDFVVWGHRTDDPFVNIDADQTEWQDLAGWDETKTTIDNVPEPGYYYVNARFYDVTNNIITTDSMVFHVVDPYAPVVSEPKTIIVDAGTSPTQDELIEQWGLTVTDNRYGDLTSTDMFNLDEYRHVDGYLSTLGVFDVKMPSDEWMADFETNHPLEPKIQQKTFKINIRVPDEAPEVKGESTIIIKGEDIYEDATSLHGLEAMDKEDGDISEQVVLETHNIPLDGDNKATTPGNYKATFGVTDSGGNYVDLELDVFVLARPTITGKDIQLHVLSDYTHDLHEVIIEDEDSPVIDTDTGEPIELQSELIETTLPEGKVTVDPGLYHARYRAVDGHGLETIKTFNIEVLNDKPVITHDDVELTVGDDYEASMHNAVATDTEEGNLIPTVQLTSLLEKTLTNKDAGLHFTTFVAEDSFGGKTEVQSKVTVKGVPVIESKTATFYVGDVFDPELLDFTVTDYEDGDLRDQVTYTIPRDSDGKPVHLSVPEFGEEFYGETNLPLPEIIVTVTDSDGNKTVGRVNFEVKLKGVDPVIEAKDIILNVGDIYDPSLHEATASDEEDGVLTPKVLYSQLPVGSIITTPGHYVTRFSVTDSHYREVDKEVSVTVKGLPIITTKDVKVVQGDKFDPSIFEISIEDYEDGIITGYQLTYITPPVLKDGVYHVAETYEVLVTAKDSDGNEAKETFTITVLPLDSYGKEETPDETPDETPENSKPTITGNDITLTVGEVWSESLHGVIAMDKEDGKLTPTLEFRGFPSEDDNTLFIPGKYPVKFSVTDSDGNYANIELVLTILDINEDGSLIYPSDDDSPFGNDSGYENDDIDYDDNGTGEELYQYGSPINKNILYVGSILMVLLGLGLMLSEKEKIKK